jgi:hypothetical protein
MTYQNTTKTQFNRPSISRRVLEIIGGGAFMLFFSYCFMWVLLNFLMGCGEAFYQADGSYIMGDCAPFLPWEFFTPNW